MKVKYCAINWWQVLIKFKTYRPTISSETRAKEKKKEINRAVVVIPKGCSMKSRTWERNIAFCATKSLEAVWWTNCKILPSPSPTHRKIILVDRDWVLFCHLCLPRSHRPERLVFSVAISQPMKSGHLKQQFLGRRRSRLCARKKKSRRMRS